MNQTEVTMGTGLLHGGQGRNQRGITLALVALCMVAFCILTAFAIDIGIAYSARTSSQHAADAAALAGAYTYVNAPTLTGTDRIQAATNDAAATANVYKVFGTRVSVSNAAQDPGSCALADNIVCVDETRKRVTVTVAAPVQLYFGRIIPGLHALQVRVMAVAEAAPNAVGQRCIKPFFVANNIIAPPPNNSGDPAACKAATDAGQTILDGNGNLTEYAKNYINAQRGFASPGTSPTQNMTDTSLCGGALGCPFSFWDQYATGNPSQWGLIDFSTGQGNGGGYGDPALVACAVSKCMQECYSPAPLYKCGDSVVGQKTGGSNGQVAQNLESVIGQNGSTPTNFYVDAPLDGTPTFRNSGVTQSTSPSLMSVIVWDCRQPLSNGTQSSVVSFAGTALIFVNNVSTRNKQSSSAFLVNAGGCGGGENQGPASVPVRLVNI